MTPKEDDPEYQILSLEPLTPPRERVETPDTLRKTTELIDKPKTVKRMFAQLNDGRGIIFNSTTGVFFDTATSEVTDNQVVAVHWGYQAALKKLTKAEMGTFKSYCTPQGNEENRDKAIVEILTAINRGTPDLENLLAKMRMPRD